MLLYDKGLLTLEQIPQFQQYLDSQNIGWAEGKHYEVMRVWCNEGWHLIHRKLNGQVSTSEKLSDLINAFKNPGAVVNDDTKRLDYLIAYEAHVVAYGIGDKYRYYLVYNDDSIQRGTFETPRQAIDAALEQLNN